MGDILIDRIVDRVSKRCVLSAFYFFLCLHAQQPSTFFKSYMNGSFFAVFCHVLLHFVRTARIIK